MKARIFHILYIDNLGGIAFYPAIVIANEFLCTDECHVVLSLV